MAKEKKKGKQLELIDVSPKNSKKLLAVALEYKEAQTERLAYLAEEKRLKVEFLDLVTAAKLTPLKDGVIRFSLDGNVITVTPRDELVQVKAAPEETPE